MNTMARRRGVELLYVVRLSGLLWKISIYAAFHAATLRLFLVSFTANRRTTARRFENGRIRLPVLGKWNSVPLRMSV